MVKQEVLVCPSEYLLSPDEDKLMDLIVNHIIDLYITNPKHFLNPILQMRSKDNNLESR